jgi:carbamoyl-phosphate synthase large subunit
MDVDVLLDAENRPWVLDINPRFGGGYPFSHVSGSNIPAAIVAWAAGREPDPTWIENHPGVKSKKHLELI